MTPNRPEIVIIAAVTRDGALGKDGDLLYHISADLRRFKSLTLGHPVIMGRKTFQSFPNGPLPGRLNVVITRNKNFAYPGIKTASSLDEAVSECIGNDKIFVIGGGRIYAEALDRAACLELTDIDAERPDADTFFPIYESEDWEIVEESESQTDPRAGGDYRLVTQRRVTSMSDTGAES
ncbi:MAG: dihydrofolate reductase [Duncaniella sp.]|nr:dihydrofolate reductase [Duncaniella sp.]